MRRRMIFAVTCTLAVSSILGAEADLASAQLGLELVAEVPPTAGITPEWIEGIQVLDDNPNEIIFVTRNAGAWCGGGTPAAAWKLTLDPSTGRAVTVELKQLLSEIQEVRGSVFESSDGTLFTGGGWCLHKPPYVSTDGGETWRAASIGTHPPNSTFSLVEYEGEIYAGTGYCPFHAQVYRWLGGPPNDWELVFDIPPPRSIVAAMVAYHGRLFVGTHVYWYDGCNSCEGTVPVYVSDDGVNFEPTSGIPSCQTVTSFGLLAVSDELFARTHACGDGSDRRLYRWNETVEQWELHVPLDIQPYFGRRDLVQHQGVMYIYGQRPGDPWGIYTSTDLGLSWTQVVEMPNPQPTCMEIHDGTVYIGTQPDASDTAYIYRLGIRAEVDIDPDVLNPRSEGRWVTGYIELPEGYDPEQIDVSTVMLNDTVPAELHPTSIGDHDEDGTPDRMVKFPRAEVFEILPNGEEVEVCISGQVAGQPFRGCDTLRVLMPKITYPNGGEVLETGQGCAITWEAPLGYSPDRYLVFSTCDSEGSWGFIAESVAGTSCTWTVPQVTSVNYRVLVEAYDIAGIMGYDMSDGAFTVGEAAGAPTEEVIPIQFALHQANPNPSTQQTAIRFEVPETRRVSIAIHDAQGRLVRHLTDEVRSAGSYTVQWDGKDGSARELPTGVYFVRLDSGDWSSTRKVVLLR